MKYKVGDKVSVRPGLKRGIFYGNLRLIKTMAPSESMTIASIRKSFSGFPCYEVQENTYLWTDEMLKPASKRCIMTSENQQEKSSHEPHA